MTAAEYHKAVTNYDRDQAERELAALPKNLNPTGKIWRGYYRRIQLKYNVTL